MDEAYQNSKNWIVSFKKKLKQKLKLRFYLYLESEKPAYQIGALKVGISVCAVLIWLPRTLTTVIKSEAQTGDFKIVFRRAWWLLNQLILKRTYRYDRYFDFSIGLNVAAASAMYGRLERANWRIQKLERFDIQIYLAQLAAASVDGDLSPGETILLSEAKNEKNDKNYVKHINNALNILKNSEEAAQSNENQQPSYIGSAASDEQEIESKLGSRKNQFSEHAKPIFTEFVNLLSHANISVFAISGTLLGIIRENAFLAHDYDIDLGVLDDIDFEKLLLLLQNNDLFYIKKVDYPSYRSTSTEGGVEYYRLLKPALIKVGHRNTGVHIDLFTHFKQGDVFWHGSTLHRWDNSPFSLTSKEFLGLRVLIPEDYDLYLTENYGDWKTPVTEFNCSTGTPNASISSNPRTLCYYLKLSFDNLSELKAYQYLQGKLILSGLVLKEENRYYLSGS